MRKWLRSSSSNEREKMGRHQPENPKIRENGSNEREEKNHKKSKYDKMFALR
jgi:hypothetical protein